jgi:hypothetical protein
LLKLGITVSERTVSRYLQGRMKAPSQTWRTFLANEFSQFALASTVTSSDEPGDQDCYRSRVAARDPRLVERLDECPLL